MRKVIGIGETILDIIFRGDQPHSALPGGSAFNSMVSLSRLGVPVSFIGELGNDRVGEIVRRFMQANGMTTDYIDCFPDGKSPVSLAFLNKANDAEYIFYTHYPDRRSSISYPVINADDIVLFGSFYAVHPLTRDRIVELLEYARERQAIIYYDPNFRQMHAHEAIRVRSTIMDNYEFAGMVRGSDEDFLHLYGLTDMDKVYRDEVGFYCKTLITTRGTQGVNLYTETLRRHFETPVVTPVSTVGAGDNFNAGIIYGLIKYGIGYHDLPALSEPTWAKIIRCGMELAAEACQNYANYIPVEFAEKYRENIS
ncbi:MAG: carbohydrate kinase [Tannerella sp.]|jgi:fructokinase|nr:carbohydrate kinase [Tannerella sp.]